MDSEAVVYNPHISIVKFLQMSLEFAESTFLLLLNLWLFLLRIRDLLFVYNCLEVDSVAKLNLINAGIWATFSSWEADVRRDTKGTSPVSKGVA
jgi:hypothetical protein